MSSEEHIDKKCAEALARLNKELCSFYQSNQRKRKYTLILIPERMDEPIHVSKNGKPLPKSHRVGLERMVKDAMICRGKNA